MSQLAVVLVDSVDFHSLHTCTHVYVHACTLNVHESIYTYVLRARALVFTHILYIYTQLQTNGLVDLEVLKREIRPDTVLVSVMAVNNEIGVSLIPALYLMVCVPKKMTFALL